MDPSSSKRCHDDEDDDIALIDAPKKQHHNPPPPEVTLPSGAATTNYSRTQIPRPSMNEVKAETDPVKVPGLNFIVFSCAAQGLRQVTADDQCAVKIRGAFDTPEQANAHAKVLQEKDPHWDIYVAPMYDWFLVPPTTAMCEEVVHPNKTIEEIMNNELRHRHRLADDLESRIQGAKDDLNRQDMVLD